MPIYSDPSASLGLKLLKNQRIVTVSPNTERFIQHFSRSFKKIFSQTNLRGKKKKQTTKRRTFKALGRQHTLSLDRTARSP